MKLYVLGNGFDLLHSLPTSYRHFYEFAQETLDEVSTYFQIELSSDENPWHDFENRLGEFHWRSFYTAHDNTDVASDDFRPSHVYSLEDELTERATELVESLETQFHDWVAAIDVAGASKQIAFDPTSRFISFNYTSTLQDAYRIEDRRVLHIHGRAGDGDLTFGHGVQIQEEPEFDPQSGESNRTMFSDAEGSAKYPLYALRKKVGAIIDKNRSYFESLGAVSEIVVIGHSLNDVDLPYFREIARYARSASWVVYCYKESDRQHHLQQLILCGVPNGNIELRQYHGALLAESSGTVEAAV